MLTCQNMKCTLFIYIKIINIYGCIRISLNHLHIVTQLILGQLYKINFEGQSECLNTLTHKIPFP